MRVPITDLVGQPGATRKLATSFAREEAAGTDWGPGDEALASLIEVDVDLEMLVDGLLVEGTVAFTTVVACARCLRDVPRDERLRLTELFADPAKVDDVEPGYELADGAIDLETMLRDAVVTALPVRVLCREDCRGLCPACGADRNVESCGHDQMEDRDPRWAALARLRLPPS